jgi:RNA polymerase sigma-70 factor (ECF subfamily)
MGDYPSDATLLERFVTCREEAAFAALVKRHGPRVLGACRRNLRNEHDAEDAFQATFLLLARRAAEIRWRESVAGWLCAAAHRVSMNARGDLLRRYRRELPLATSGVGAADHGSALYEDDHPDADPLSRIARRELRPMLDDALDRLPEKYRAPVVLCYLEGLTNEEAARALGWPAGSMSRRLERARGLLRRRLAGRVSLFILLLLAAIATFGIGLGVPRGHRGTAVLSVSAAASRSHKEEGGELERLLARIGESDPSLPPGPDAIQAARLAEAMADQIDDGRFRPNRAQAAQQATELRSSALLLAHAGQASDDPALRDAARRLSATCLRCHLALRQ